MNPIISIIIPCYNQARFLSDSIASVQAQTYTNWECIIINDGSTDNTVIIAEKLAQTDARIRVINQANKGLSGARNAGLRAANGEMLQFLDADDMLEQDKLRTQAAFLHANPDIDIVFGDARYFTTENPKLRKYGFNTDESWIPERWQTPEPLIEKFLKANLFPVNCPLVRRSLFHSVGEWNIALEAHEDWEFWLRCVIANKKIAYCDNPNSLALIRMHPESMSNDISRMWRSTAKMRIAIGNILKSPELRLINFKNSLHELQLYNPPDIINYLFKFLLSNISPPAFFMAFHFLLKFVWCKKLINTYKKSMPWPIQKTLIKISHFSKTFLSSP